MMMSPFGNSQFDAFLCDSSSLEANNGFYAENGVQDDMIFCVLMQKEEQECNNQWRELCQMHQDLEDRRRRKDKRKRETNRRTKSSKPGTADK